MLSFAFGIIVAIYNINNMKILGKGFYLMMHLIFIGFILLSIFTESVVTIIILEAFSLSLASLNILTLYSSTKFITTKKLINAQLLIFVTILLITAALILEAINSKNIKNEFLEIFRYLSGGLLLGFTLTAMLLGHWYLVQPGLNRSPIKALCNHCLIVQFIVCAGWLFKPSMLQVFSGTIDDGWNGMLFNMWLGASITSFVILLMARKALSEKSYSAVMATTGLLYLVILLAAGIELIPRSIFF